MLGPFRPSPTTGIHPDGDRVGGTLALGDGVGVTSVGYLATYTYQATGGSAGSLSLIAVSVDTARTDYLFNGITALYKGANLPAQRYGAILDAPGAGITRAGQVYLATFTLQPVGGATGVFHISIREGTRSFLLNPDGSRQETIGGECTVIGFGIDCFDNADCNDTNECTSDSCTPANECLYTPESAGLSCDDGLWCTVGPQECDGNGNCTGGSPRCRPGFICLEASQQCMQELP